MSILSDHEIAALCRIPSDAMYFDQTLYEARIQAMPADSTALAIAQDCTRAYTEEQRAAFQPMISPFVEGQVREIMGSITKPMGTVGGIPHMTTIPTGVKKKVLSFGVSSYGYDHHRSETFR
jgi:hypothetical protein